MMRESSAPTSTTLCNRTIIDPFPPSASCTCSAAGTSVATRRANCPPSGTYEAVTLGGNVTSANDAVTTVSDDGNTTVLDSEPFSGGPPGPASPVTSMVKLTASPTFVKLRKPPPPSPCAITIGNGAGAATTGGVRGPTATPNGLSNFPSDWSGRIENANEPSGLNTWTRLAAESSATIRPSGATATAATLASIGLANMNEPSG